MPRSVPNSAKTPGRLHGKRVVLGVGAGIAAYKACDLASRLTKEGACVTAILTRGAQKLVTPYSFEALTGQPCLTRMFHRIGPRDSAFPHLTPAEHADLVIIAPATADLMARLAHGMANDLLTTLMLSVRCPVLLCPAMNVRMWEHPATQANAAVLSSFGHTLLGPASGRLACGTEGVGRMVEPEDIVAAALKAVAP